jgi:hypothetical protein
VIWEPFVLALVLGVIVSAGLYFAYLWPSVEPAEAPDDAAREPAAPETGRPPVTAPPPASSAEAESPAP